jgi:predicted DNA-binding protein
MTIPTKMELPMDMKAMTLRLPADKAAELEATARADEKAVAETVREAIDRHIEARRKDVDFRKRIRKLMQENDEVLKRLA